MIIYIWLAILILGIYLVCSNDRNYRAWKRANPKAVMYPMTTKVFYGLTILGLLIAHVLYTVRGI